MNLRKPAAVAASAVVMSLGLTACGGGQSVEDACKIANEEATKATQDLSSVSPTDPAGSADTISDLQGTLQSTADDLENEEVKTEVSKLADQFGELSSALGDLDAAGEDPDAMQEAAGQLTDLSGEIMDQARTLNELCNNS